MKINGNDDRPVAFIEKPWSIRSELFEFLSMFVMVPIMLASVTLMIIFIFTPNLSFSISLVIGLLFALPFSYLVIDLFRISIKDWRPKQVHLYNESIILISGKKEEITIQFDHTTKINVSLYDSLEDPPRKDIDYHKIIDDILGKRMLKDIMGIFIENNEHKIVISPNLGWSKEDMETIWGPLLRIINTHDIGLGNNLKQVLYRYSIQRT